MKIEITNSDNYTIWIDSYQDGKLTIQNKVYTEPIAIQGKNIVHIEKIFQDLSSEDLLINNDTPPEIIILGTGKEQFFLPSQVQVELYRNGLSVESMNTFSAVQTFNLLVADNRNVWAWLWPK